MIERLTLETTFINSCLFVQLLPSKWYAPNVFDWKISLYSVGQPLQPCLVKEKKIMTVSQRFWWAHVPNNMSSLRSVRTQWVRMRCQINVSAHLCYRFIISSPVEVQYVVTWLPQVTGQWLPRGPRVSLSSGQSHFPMRERESRAAAAICTFLLFICLKHCSVCIVL